MFSESTKDIEAGEQAILLQDEDETAAYPMRNRRKPAQQLLIEKLMEEEDVCFSSDELTSILQAREAETEAAQKTQAEHEAEVWPRGNGGSDLGCDKRRKFHGDGRDGETIGMCTLEIRCDTILDTLKT